jgi:hypothetical protein
MYVRQLRGDGAFFVPSHKNRWPVRCSLDVIADWTSLYQRSSIVDPVVTLDKISTTASDDIQVIYKTGNRVAVPGVYVDQHGCSTSHTVYRGAFPPCPYKHDVAFYRLVKSTNWTLGLPTIAHAAEECLTLTSE